MKIPVVFIALGIWATVVQSSEVTFVKNHIYNWTSTRLRMRCTQMAHNNRIADTYALPRLDSNTITIFPNTMGHIEFTVDFFDDEEEETTIMLSDAEKQVAGLVGKFRIVYSWLHSEKISFKMKRPFEDDICEEVIVADLPTQEKDNQNRARFLATVLSGEGARESSFYFSRNSEDES